MLTTAGKVAIVTGASAGIGKATARKLINLGYAVHVGARRTAAMADLGTLGAHVHELDLTAPAAIIMGLRWILNDRAFGALMNQITRRPKRLPTL